MIQSPKASNFNAFSISKMAYNTFLLLVYNDLEVYHTTNCLDISTDYDQFIKYKYAHRDHVVIK